MKTYTIISFSYFRPSQNWFHLNRIFSFLPFSLIFSFADITSTPLKNTEEEIKFESNNFILLHKVVLIHRTASLKKMMVSLSNVIYRASHHNGFSLRLTQFKETCLKCMKFYFFVSKFFVINSKNLNLKLCTLRIPIYLKGLRKFSNNIVDPL